ncbi:MAG: GntR family transcriptional regulator [Proteobacteria bacterium]|nr:GntR family transcriptional regulator [Pseudomonadota bacterium]MBI3496112.1 GntR family transcriptional regulator [Pseudomonadota bacterium]
MAIIRETLAVQSYAELRRRILALEFEPGHRLDVDRLAEELTVSVSPIKEALKQLESEGLVEVLPRRGTVIREFDPADVADLYEAREIVETAAVRRAMDRGAHRALLGELSRTIADFTAACDRGRIVRADKALAADNRFHVLIVSATGNRRLAAIHAALIDQAHLVRRFSMRLDRAEGTMAEHQSILAALSAGDQDEAERAMRRHLVEARDAIVQETLARSVEKTAPGASRLSPKRRGS